MLHPRGGVEKEEVCALCAMQRTTGTKELGPVKAIVLGIHPNSPSERKCSGSPGSENPLQM